jgi:flagellar hook-basal body complex protein FliE
MSQPLDPMRALYSAQPIAPVGPSNLPAQAPVTDDGKTFKDVLNDFVTQVDQSQHQYDAAITAVERGETDNLHRVMIAQNEAQISLKLAVEVRNKLVEAYKETMRTQF